jgi:hypothetical protein
MGGGEEQHNQQRRGGTSIGKALKAWLSLTYTHVVVVVVLHRLRICMYIKPTTQYRGYYYYSYLWWWWWWWWQFYYY